MLGVSSSWTFLELCGVRWVGCLLPCALGPAFSGLPSHSSLVSQLKFRLTLLIPGTRSFFVVQDRFVHCGVFNSIPGLSLPTVRWYPPPPPRRDNQKSLQTLPEVHWGEWPRLRTISLITSGFQKIWHLSAITIFSPVLWGLHLLKLFHCDFSWQGMVRIAWYQERENMY